jgi:hypothetical protein
MTQSARNTEHHPTYIKMVEEALQKIAPHGIASKTAVKKWIRENYPEVSEAGFSSRVAQAIKSGINKNLFSVAATHKQSIRLVYDKVRYMCCDYLMYVL